MDPPPPDPAPHAPAVESWMRDARGGSTEALGQMMEAFRQYLLLVANQELPSGLHAKIGASDLVQQTFLEAQRGFGQFAGTSGEELRAWLRRILLNNVANVRRHYHNTDKRDVGREVSLDDTAPEQPHPSPQAAADPPSARARAEEEADLLRRALGRLPEAARQAIEWRNYERCSFAEIGRRLGRSAEAARKLWARAIEQLRQLLTESQDESR